MTETEVLHKLDIPDFRHLTKDKVIELFSLYPQMDPEVAKHAIEQFPQFSKTMIDISREYADIIKKTLEDDQRDAEKFFEICANIIDSLDAELEDSELEFDQKKVCFEHIQWVVEQMNNRREADQKFRLKYGTLGVFACVAVAGILAATLGTQVNVKIPELRQ